MYVHCLCPWEVRWSCITSQMIIYHNIIYMYSQFLKKQYELSVILISATPGSLSLTSFGIDINCTSNITDDNRAVMVQCEYDTTMYNGFNAYIQSDQSDNNVSNLISSSSTESNSSVVVNGSTNGDHYVFVYPIWMPGSVISDNKMEPAYARIHDLEGFDSPITTIAPSGERMLNCT